MDPDELFHMRGGVKCLWQLRGPSLGWVVEHIVKPWLEWKCLTIDQKLGRGVMARIEQFLDHSFLKYFGKISEIQKALMFQRCDGGFDLIGVRLAIPCLPQACD